MSYPEITMIAVLIVFNTQCTESAWSVIVHKTNLVVASEYIQNWLSDYISNTSECTVNNLHMERWPSTVSLLGQNQRHWANIQITLR